MRKEGRGANVLHDIQVIKSAHCMLSVLQYRMVLCPTIAGHAVSRRPWTAGSHGQSGPDLRQRCEQEMWSCCDARICFSCLSCICEIQLACTNVFGYPVTKLVGLLLAGAILAEDHHRDAMLLPTWMMKLVNFVLCNNVFKD